MTKIAKAVQAKKTPAPKAAPPKSDAIPATVADVAAVPEDYVPDTDRSVAPLPPPEQDFRPTSASATKELTVLLVGIKRGLEVIPGEFFKHELPLLKLIHLPEDVNVIDAAYSAVDVIDSAGAELARIKSKYKQHPDLVNRVFPFAHTVAQATGLRDDENEYGEAPQSVQIVNRRKPTANAAG